MEEEEVTAAESVMKVEQPEALGVKLTWGSKGLTTEEALAELTSAKAAAALSVALNVKRETLAGRLAVETAAALLHAEIHLGDGLTEIDTLRIVRAVKKRVRRQTKALAATVKVAG